LDYIIWLTKPKNLSWIYGKRVYISEYFLNGIKLGRVLIDHFFIPALDIKDQDLLFLFGKLTEDIARTVLISKV